MKKPIIIRIDNKTAEIMRDIAAGKLTKEEAMERAQKFCNCKKCRARREVHE